MSIVRLTASERFIIPMTLFLQHQHKHYNTLLNRLKTESSLPSHIGSPLDYSHRYLVDSFYATEGNDKDKIRVTQDDKTGATLECMRKLRLGNLDIHSPKRAADWRVSVNLEVPGAVDYFFFQKKKKRKLKLQNPSSATTRWRCHSYETKRSSQLFS